MDVEQFDYDLPRELIAQEPFRPRDHSRMLVLRRSDGTIQHRRFFDIVEFLMPGDLLVVNNTRVIRARLLGRGGKGGGKIEILLLRKREDDLWEALVKPGRAARAGKRIIFGEQAQALVEEATDYGGRVIRFEGMNPESGLLERFGEVPTPPYIHRKVSDADEYQTVYAEHEGSAAAPTAGFHFTPKLLDSVKNMGVRLATVTLHIGIDTFRPIKSDKLDSHKMHSEMFEIPPLTADLIQETRRSTGRIVAVGTTTVRALESACRDGVFRAAGGWTNLFIRPGHRFQMVDALITNFHLPRSTLLVLVSAFATREMIMSAYAEAVLRRYRFYSFGDAMLIL